MTATALGTLEPVKLRNVWENEATEFTPWLAKEDNLKLLGGTIGIDLELEATEKDVGPFRADLLPAGPSNSLRTSRSSSSRSCVGVGVGGSTLVMEFNR